MNRVLPLLIILSIVCFSQSAKAQVVATEGKVEHTKGDKIAAVIELPYPVEEVEQAIADHFSKKGGKSDNSKGFQIFRSMKLNDSDGEVNDLHFKVERKSRKEKDISVVYLLVGRPSENVGVRSSSDRHKIDEAKAFLNQLTPSVEAHHLDIQIGSQEGTLTKALKKQQNLADDNKDLQEKIKSLQTKLDQNRSDSAKQADEVIRQQGTLDAMKARKKG
jgi:peptidoglycan hydrolase CwlO-like protein